MNATITGDSAVTVHEKMDPDSPSIGTLSADDEFEAGHSIRGKGGDWISVKLASGLQGYLLASTSIFKYCPAKLNQDEVNVLGAKRLNASVEGVLRKGEAFDVVGVSKGDGKPWFKIRTGKISGFVGGDTRMEWVVVPDPNRVDFKADYRRKAWNNMVYGGVFFVGGWIITICTYNSAATNGGTYFFCWGPILFGGMAMAKGIYEWVTMD